MSVRNSLEVMIAAANQDDPRTAEVRRWLARTEALLDWVAKHPKLVEVNCEAGHLLAEYRGEQGRAADVDYRGIGRRSRS